METPEPVGKELFHNKWLSLWETPDGYIYSSETCGTRVKVGVLGYKKIDDEIEFVGRFERNPAHHYYEENYEDIPFDLAALTGTMEPEIETPEEMAVIEFKEEAGVDIDVGDLIDLGVVRTSKSQDTYVYLYAVDMEDKEIGKSTGDGTQGEEDAYCNWINAEQARDCKDPLIHSMMIRLFDKLV